MTIRKRLSRTNTRILLFALLSLLVIGVFIIEIFEKTYLEQAINYVKLQDHSVELVDFLDEYQFSEDEIRNTRKKDPELWSQLLYRKRQAKSQYGFFYKTASGDAVFRFLCYHQ